MLSGRIRRPALDPIRPPADAMLTMTPLFLSRKIGNDLRMVLIGPVVLMANTRSHNSSVRSATGTKLSIMPALLIKISSVPYSLTVASTSRCTSSSLATFATNARAVPPFAVIPSTTACAPQDAGQTRQPLRLRRQTVPLSLFPYRKQSTRNYRNFTS